MGLIPFDPINTIWPTKAQILLYKTIGMKTNIKKHDEWERRKNQRKEKRHATRLNKTNLLQQKQRGNERRQKQKIVEHHQLVPSQYKRGGPMVNGFRGCGLVGGGGNGSIFGFQMWLLLGIYLARMVSYPKEVVDGWDNLMHAIMVGGEVA